MTLSLLIGLSSVPGAAVGQPAADPGNGVHIRQLARALADAPEPLRRDFVQVAIPEMVEAYESEADLARRESYRGTADRDARRWSVAVRRQAAELSAIAASVTESTPVSVGIDGNGRVFVIVDGRLAILTIPRMNEQLVFEQRVAARFCDRNVCEDLLGVTGRKKPGENPSTAGQRWSFSDHAGPACSSDDGLEIQFASASNLWWKRAACAAVIRELAALASEIALERDNGTPLDWNSVAIQPHTRKDLRRIVLNKRGDYLLMPVPALSAVPDFFGLALPWLVARTDGVRYHLVVVNAERLLAPLSDLEERP
ncbi:MAG: hypothetical protein U9R74_15525 [Pseudomonadota bacterium]|nr:hypothetical protein [Pseudomonadota bacterium]